MGVQDIRSKFQKYARLAILRAALFGLERLREMKSAGGCFSKVSETFLARKTIFSYLYLKNREVYRPETLYEGNFSHI